MHMLNRRFVHVLLGMFFATAIAMAQPGATPPSAAPPSATQPTATQPTATQPAATPPTAKPVNVADYPNVISVACAGDSITAGYGGPAEVSYPAQLGRMLGEKWAVRGYGRSGTTLLNKGSLPYQKGPMWRILGAPPDVIVIMLGTNDTNPGNWSKKADFEADYKDMIKKFSDLASKPRIYICTPPPVLRNGRYGCSEANILEEIPMIEKVAKEMKVDVIDVHGALKARESENLLPDNIHPNAAGSTVIAATIYEALTGAKPTEEVLKAAIPPQAEVPLDQSRTEGK